MANNVIKGTKIVYRGPSLFNGAAIVVLVQDSSINVKTGAMVQTFILDDSGMDPMQANRTGADSSICGDCVHMGIPNNNTKGQATNRSCYVTLHHAPLGKYKALKRGAYGAVQGHDAIASLGRGKQVRLGSYGDPAACPSHIWESLISESTGHTAYTHGKVNPMPDKIMSSVDSPTQAIAAWQRKERTFRVISSLDKLIKGKEVLCPASVEAGRRSTCDKCLLCSGAGINAKNIAIVAHGTSARKVKESNYVNA
jgi:hypothetical protein